MTGMEIFLLALVCLTMPMALSAALNPKKQNTYLVPAVMWGFCAAMTLPTEQRVMFVVGVLQLIMAVSFAVGYLRSKHDSSVS